MSSIKITSLVAVALVCSAAGLATADNPNDCDICKDFVDTFQQNSEALSAILEVFYKPPFCSNETDCEEMRELVQTLEVLFMLLSPQENCELVGICESDQNSSRGLVSKALGPAKRSGSLMGRVFGKKIATKAKGSDCYPVCDTCQQAVEGFKKDLELTAELFQTVCGFFPADQHDECEQFASKILDKLKRQTPKQFCYTIGLCPKN